ncbi:protein kinase family protein [Streptomyces tendae]|uniref:hypothetical protein n=1 Tax=Streptomyces tendae TaxID=1932 RepID=UPI00369AB7AA
MGAVDPWARSRAEFVAQAERLVAELEASTDPGAPRLLREARRALRDLKHPEKVRRRRVPASEDVLRHRARLVRQEALAAELEEDA